MSSLCRTDGRCQYAIDHGAEGLGHCPDGNCAMPRGMPVTEEMVTAYLTANDAYWKRIDGEPTKLGKWRNGTPSEATRISLRAALSAAPATTAWQPIDTAPKDGSEILLYSPGRLTYGAWSEPSKHPRILYKDGFAPEPEWDEWNAYWASYDGGFTDANPPTHWMPLPPAPEAK